MSPSRAATALLLVLIAACTMAFLRAEQLKLRRSPVTKPKLHQSFSPGCTQVGCRPVADLQFTLRRPLTVSLAIADMDGRVVRTLDRNRRYPKGDVRFAWDGRTDSGAKVPDGRYELKVTIPDRTITIPEPILVDTQRPGMTVDRVKRGPTILVYYTKGDKNSRPYMIVSEKGRVVRERRLVLNPARLPTAELGPGTFLVHILAIDAAGNRTPDPPAFSVKVP